MGESQSSSNTKSGPSFATIVLVALLAAGVIGALVGVVIVRATDDDVTALTLEPADATGANPFTGSVAGAGGPVNPNTQNAVAATRASFTKDPNTGALIAPANAPGLYGGSGDTKVCNPQQLVEFLTQDQTKAKAWASVLDISTNDIAGYVASLTPVLLTNDTLVTNHGYKNGKATTTHSVLQAGTAVMVDATGTPRVKCNCGNPLTEPQTITLTNATLTGTAWPNYNINNFTTIHTTTQITNLVIINIQTGTTYTQPIPTPYTPADNESASTTTSGTGGVVVAIDVVGPGGPPETGFYVTTHPSDPSTWQKVFTAQDGVQGIGFGDGKFVAVGDDGIYTSDATGRTWARAAAAPTTAYLSDVAYGDGRWLASGRTRTTTGSGSPVVYESTDTMTWTEVSALSNGNLGSIAYGGGLWVASIYDRSANANLTTLSYSADGTTWTPTNARGQTVGYSDSAGWLSFGGSDHPDTTGEAKTADDLFHAYTWTSTDGQTWTEHTTNPRSISAGGGIVYVDGRWYAASWNPQGAGLEGVVTSADGVTWSSAGQLPSGPPNDLAAS